ncbi:metallophosphoesterase family protein [Mediterraneibacter sp. ICN-202921]|uniref:metallophosphoesterase family protein n=1 Tax=Mediterraneibacter sp. ICN-202921 TaxID=3134657 RepID=UPI000E553AE7|nr:metallophosphoesterase [Ruminococcus sp. AF18-22]
MRILIVSDTHGKHKNLDCALEKAGAVDMFIHLGDVEGGEEYINAVIDCETHMVRGNNDFFSELPPEEEFYIGRYKVFITHGHNYYVSLDTECIREEGVARNADIVMFGHTHRPFLECRDGVTLLNPGSLSYPRQEGRKGSYMIMEMDENGHLAYTHYYLE